MQPSASAMTKIIINGSKGQMGQALARCASRLPEVQVVGQVDVGDNLAALLPQADVVIEFSFHAVTAEVVALCAKHQKALVIGTTGHTPEERARITGFKSQIPIVWASNYSTGVNTLFWLTRKAAEILGPNFDLEVVEMHHRLKKDAPSGTATTLIEILGDVRKLQLEMSSATAAPASPASAPRRRSASTPSAAVMWSGITP